MHDNLVYMFGKLSKAVEILITNHGDVRNRVWVASSYIFMVRADSLPESLRPDIEWIQTKMTRYPANELHHSSLEATYHRTKNTTAGKIAARVWTLYHLMSSAIEERQREVPESGELPVVVVNYDNRST